MSERKTNRPPVATRCLRDLCFPEGINLELRNSGTSPKPLQKQKTAQILNMELRNFGTSLKPLQK